MKRIAIALAVTAALAAAGCGGSSGGSGNGGGATGSADDAATIRLWLNGTDTKDEVVQYAVSEFTKLHPKAKVSFERQQWTGIVDKLTTSLSGKDSPDVVELGNTDAAAFEAAGALMDLTDKKADLGGDDLLQSLVESGTYDNKLYAAPYYAGSRIVVYRKDLLAKSGLKVPTTMDEFVQAGIKLKQDNASTPGFSGIYFPGKAWREALSFLWLYGGDLATQGSDGKWTGNLADPKSVQGLQLVQKIMNEANGAPKDADESKDYVSVCNNQVAMLMGPGWKIGQITDPKTGCPGMKDKLGAFALPGLTAGTTAPVFLGGSNIGISAKSQHQALAYDLLKIMVSAKYQEMMAKNGLLPALKSQLSAVSGDEGVKVQAVTAQNSRFTPSSPNWAGIEGSNLMEDLFVKIAKGGDITAEATKTDEQIAAKLNAS